jgi:hypothetical protein
MVARADGTLSFGLRRPEAFASSIIMAIYRVDLLTGEPDPVFDWLGANVPEPYFIRSAAFKTVSGWYFKCVFKRQEDAEAFHHRWHPDAEDHSVAPFGWHNA